MNLLSVENQILLSVEDQILALFPFCPVCFPLILWKRVKYKGANDLDEFEAFSVRNYVLELGNFQVHRGSQAYVGSTPHSCVFY